MYRICPFSGVWQVTGLNFTHFRQIGCNSEHLLGTLCSLVGTCAALRQVTRPVSVQVHSVGNMKRPIIDQQVTFLSAPDLEATAAFYEGLIGLSLVLDQGTCRIYHVANGAFLGFCKHLPAVESESPVIVTLVSQEVDAWYEYLLTKGAAVPEQPVLNRSYNIYHFFVRDPSGYLVEIQEFLDPAWPAE